MKEQKTDPQGIYQEYNDGISYKQGLPQGSLFDVVTQNENFYIGRQWEGVNAPDLDKPVLNLLGRVVSFFIAMIASDSISVSVSPFNVVIDDAMRQVMLILSSQIDQVIEDNDLTGAAKDYIRAAAVDGDAGMHIYFDPDEETGQEARGLVKIERVPNVCEFLGNPYRAEIRDQPYIILASRRMVEDVQEEMRQNKQSEGEIEALTPDSDLSRGEYGQSASDNNVTVLTKYWMEGGTVRVAKVTQSATVKPPTDTGYKRYPYCRMSWIDVRDSCNGQAAVSALIPNQIAINKIYAMVIKQIRDLAFQRIVYDMTKIPTWSNRLGAIGVNGDPREAIASVTPQVGIPPQAVPFLESFIAQTRDLMGASDAALGNVKPDNTSAIIAVQQSTAAPLDLQKRSFYRMVEDAVRIFMDIIRADYGIRWVLVTDELGQQSMAQFDFSKIGEMVLRLKVDVGASAYWSEMTQLQTAQNLFTSKIITDPIDLLERIPDSQIKDKNRLIAKLRQQREQAEMLRAAQAPMGGEVMGNAMPPM